MSDVLICAGCGKTPEEIPDYKVYAREAGVSATQYCWEEEGTLDHTTGKFLCDPCYIKAGMPAVYGGPNWTATPKNIAALKEKGLL